ncbi:hypothetical protein, partial, partial [Absidia glauca]
SGPSSTINVTSLLPLSPPPIATTMLSKSNNAPPSAASSASSLSSIGSAGHALFPPIHPTDDDHPYTGHQDTYEDGHSDDDSEEGGSRHQYQRNNSSSSSMSGLVVTFSRHREPSNPQH